MIVSPQALVDISHLVAAVNETEEVTAVYINDNTDDLTVTIVADSRHIWTYTGRGATWTPVDRAFTHITHEDEFQTDVQTRTEEVAATLYENEARRACAGGPQTPVPWADLPAGLRAPYERYANDAIEVFDQWWQDGDPFDYYEAEFGRPIEDTPLPDVIPEPEEGNHATNAGD